MLPSLSTRGRLSRSPSSSRTVAVTAPIRIVALRYARAAASQDVGAPLTKAMIAADLIVPNLGRSLDLHMKRSLRDHTLPVLSLLVLWPPVFSLRGASLVLPRDWPDERTAWPYDVQALVMSV